MANRTFFRIDTVQCSYKKKIKCIFTILCNIYTGIKMYQRTQTEKRVSFHMDICMRLALFFHTMNMRPMMNDTRNIAGTYI